MLRVEQLPKVQWHLPLVATITGTNTIECDPNMETADLALLKLRIVTIGIAHLYKIFAFGVLSSFCLFH